MYLISRLITSSRIKHLRLFLIRRMLLLNALQFSSLDREYSVTMDERIEIGWSILVLSRIVSSASANALVSRNGRNMTDTIVP